MEGLENPYLGWYDDEKWLMEEEYRKKEEDPNYKINYSLFGHYNTLRNKVYKTTGVSWYGGAGEQFFSAQDDTFGPTCTPDEFIAGLTAYAKKYEDAVTSAENTKKSLEANEPEYLTAARTKLEEAKKKQEAAKNAATSAKETLADANSQLETKTNKLNEVTEDYERYKAGTYAEAKSSYEAAFSALTAFNTANPEIEQNLKNAETVLDQAKAAKEAAETGYNEALSEKNEAETAYKKASANLQERKTEIANTKSELEIAQADVTTKQMAYENATRNYDASVQAVSDRKAESEALESAKNEAEKTLKEKESAKDQANSNLQEKKEKVSSAENELSSKESSLNVAEAALSQADSALKTANERKTKAEGSVKEKQTAVDTASKELESAKEKYEQAKKVKKEDPSTYEENFPELAELEKSVSAAEKILNEKKQALSDAEENEKSAQDAYDKACREYAAAVADYNIALSYVDKYTVYDIGKVSGIKVSGISNKTYTGKAIKQNIKVTHNGKPATFKVSYSGGNTTVGKHTVIITGTGKYTGTRKYTYSILPKTVGGRSYKKKKTSITVSYKKVKGVSGYQIAYRVKGASKWKYKTTTGKSKKLSSLKRRKTYEIRVRTYKTVKKTKYYSNWSGISKVKTK